MEEKCQIVASIEGLYDEEETLLVKSKLQRNWLALGCLFGKHNFVNGFLDQRNAPTGGYDLLYRARFCEHCLKIDCIHQFEHHCYEVKVHSFYFIQYEIAHCRLCGRRISMGSCGVTKSSTEAESLMLEVQKELGLFMTFGGELSCAASQILETKGVEAAKAFLRQTYLSQRIPRKGMMLAGY